MRWPQIAMIVLFGLSFGISLSKHGQKKEGTENCWITLIGILIHAVILYFGGFWK